LRPNGSGGPPGILTEPLTRRLPDLAGIRNVLVHTWRNRDREQDAGALTAFLDAIQEHLRKPRSVDP